MKALHTSWYWAAVGCTAIANFSVIVWLFFCTLENYYDKPSPVDWAAELLLFPAILLFPLLGESSLLIIPLNSVLWGLVLAEPIRWWCGGRFSLRTLLAAVTIIAILLGIRVWTQR
jgi:hypothetical protein